MVGDLTKHTGGENMDEGQEGLQGEDEVEEGEIVDEVGEVPEEGEEVDDGVLKNDDGRDHLKVTGVQESSQQKLFCEKSQEVCGSGFNSRLYHGFEKEEGQMKEPKRRDQQEDGGEQVDDVVLHRRCG